MCFHGLSVLNHKEMLVDDLKDELDTIIPIEKYEFLLPKYKSIILVDL